MEVDLLKETWPMMDLLEKPNTQKTKTTKEDNTVFSIWEENYQDLSGWCIDGFQGRCAFPIGELETSKSFGMKSDDNGVSIQKTGVMGEVSGRLLGEKECLEDSSVRVPELPVIVAEMESELEDLQRAVKSEIIENRSIEMKDVLLLNPIDYPINQRTDDWVQLANIDVPNAPPISTQKKSVNHQKNNNIVIAEYPSSVPYEIAKTEEDNWDPINTFDNNDSENFDLLSYLCDDNIQSPEGSVVSRGSELTIATSSSLTSQVDEPSSLTIRNLRRDRRNNNVRGVENAQANVASTSSSIAAISAALDSVAAMSKRSSRNREKRNAKSIGHSYEVGVGRSRGKKRCTDSDSEDRTSDGSYRESREKNNEASRKSRQNKKAKENEMKLRASELERDNRILKMKVEELDKLVTSMRTAILRSALKKSF